MTSQRYSPSRTLPSTIDQPIAYRGTRPGRRLATLIDDGYELDSNTVTNFAAPVPGYGGGLEREEARGGLSVFILFGHVNGHLVVAYLMTFAG